MQFYEPSSARAMLVETVDIDDDDVVSAVEEPYFGAVLIYAHREAERALPELHFLLKSAESLQEHNRILASYDGERLYLVVVEDAVIRICNSFKAQDFTTAEYFLFMVLKKFQMNPEMSSIYFRTHLTDDQKLSLYQYFKAVEQI